MKIIFNWTKQINYSVKVKLILALSVFCHYIYRYIYINRGRTDLGKFFEYLWEPFGFFC